MNTQIQESTFNANEVEAIAREDLDFLAALLMPAVFSFLYPPIFKAIWHWLLDAIQTTRAFPQLALGLPRGFAKTTFMKVFVCFCILFTQRKFILVICASAKLAENFTADVVDMLTESNILKVFGDWRVGVEKDTQDLRKFSFRGRTIILAAVGAGTSLRGLNLKHERPDLMIFDDVQTRECADSQIQSEALERWMYGTAMKAKSPRGCMFVFLANMYPTKHSLLKKLKRNPTWLKFIVGGILKDGTSLWEELQPVEQLLQEYENDKSSGHPEIFAAEVLNDEEASMNYLFDVTKMKEYPFAVDDPAAGNFIVIDPSGDKANSDAVSIGYFEIHDTLPVLMSVDEGRYSPGETIRRALTVALRHNCRLIVIESVAYQASLCYWFEFVCNQMGIIGVEAVEIYPGQASKNSRILTMFKSVLAGEIYINPAAMPQVLSQILAFNPLRRDNTDGILDLLTYAPKVIELYSAYIISLGVIGSQDIGSAQVLSLEENCCF